MIIPAIIKKPVQDNPVEAMVKAHRRSNCGRKHLIDESFEFVDEFFHNEILKRNILSLTDDCLKYYTRVYGGGNNFITSLMKHCYRKKFISFNNKKNVPGNLLKHPF